MIRGIVALDRGQDLPPELVSWIQGTEAGIETIGGSDALFAQSGPSLNERPSHLPRDSGRQGRPIAVATARLDGREELCRALDLAANESASLADAALARLAMLRWGNRSPLQLQGEFTVAQWDGEQRSLILARDRHGVHPLYYLEFPGFVAFATRIKELCRIPGHEPEFDPVGLTMAVAGRFGCKDVTPFKFIQRLPPAHWIRFTSEGTHREEYWRLDLEREIVLKSDGDYAERLRDLFVRAVRARIDSPTRIGAALSGGMDSSSICGVAARLLEQQGREPLAAFSAMLPLDSPFSEEKYIRAVVEHSRIDFRPFDLANLTPTHRLEEILDGVGTPYLGGNLFIPDTAYAMAHKAGVGIYMDGYDGDNAVGHGLEKLTFLAKSQQWFRLYQEYRALYRAGGVLGGAAAGKPRHRLAQSMWRVLVEPSAPYRLVRGAGSRAKRLVRGAPAPVPVAPPLLHRHHLEELIQRERQCRGDVDPRKGPRHCHASIIGSGQQAWLLELTAALADSHGIEVRLPFFDTPLIEFCLAIPVEQKMRDGLTRWVMRNAMEGYLPDLVRLRPDKSNYEINFAEALRRDELPRMRRLLLQEDLGLDVMVNMDRLRTLVAQLEEGKLLGADLSALYRMLVLAVWMDRRQNRVRP